MPTKKTLSPKDRAADKRLKTNYSGFGLEHHSAVLKFQKGVCAICKQAPVIGKPRFSVDHRHSDGLLRGLLCWKCNRAIGAFQRFHPDAVDLFWAAWKYLKNPPITNAFGKQWFTAPGKVGTKKRAKLLKQMEANPNKGINAA